MSKIKPPQDDDRAQLSEPVSGESPQVSNPGSHLQPVKPGPSRMARLFSGVDKEPPESPYERDLALQTSTSQSVPSGQPAAGTPVLALARSFVQDITSNRETLYTLLLIGVALASALAAPIIARNYQLTVLFYAGIAGLVAVLVVLRWPIVGVVGMIIAALASSFSIGTGTETGVNAGVILLMMLIGLWIFEMVSRKREIRLLKSPAVTACLVFCVIAVLAFGFGQISWFPIQAAPITAQIGGLMIFILTAGIFLVIGHQLNTVKELQWITWVFLACAALYVIGRFVTGIPSERIYRYFVREATLGCLFYVWVGAMATGQALFNTKLAKGWRVALGVLVVAIFYMNMGQSRFWLSGWLPMLVAVAAVLVIARPQFGGFIVICGIIIVLLNTQSVGGILSEGDNVYSTETRLAAWRIVGEIIKVNPLFGLGMANYYYYTPLFNMMGYNISFNSHNNYIDLVAQAGLLGLICFGWLVWEIWKLGLRVKNAVPEGFPRAYAYGALGGLVGTVFAGLLGDWVVPFVYNIGLNGFRASMLGWMFLGGLLVLEKLFIQPVDKSASV